jgi:hypothetical protein
MILGPKTAVTRRGECIDLIAIERRLAGERVPLTVPEQVHAARLLIEAGRESSVAHLLGVNGRTAGRLRKKVTGRE